MQCNLTDAVHQLISNHSVHAEDESTKSGLNYTVSVSEFPAVAAGSVLYLSSPGLVCAAVGKGRWGEETDHFLHEVTHGDCHDHHHHHHGKSEHCDDHGHENMDVHGLETLLHELNHHYEPSENEVAMKCLCLRNIFRCQSCTVIADSCVCLRHQCVHHSDDGHLPYLSHNMCYHV